MSTCPSKSPESKSPCYLEDNELDHYLGHEALGSYMDHTISWGTSKEDHERWARAKS